MTLAQKLHRSAVDRARYQRNADNRAKKQSKARAFKQRVLLQRAIESARAEIAHLARAA